MATRPRIAVWYNLPSGGSKRALWDHLQGLKQRGYQLEAWRPPIPDPTYLPISGLIPEHEVELTWPKYGARTYFGRLREIACMQEWRLEAMEDHARRCAEQISKGGFDLFFGNTCMQFHVPFVARFLEIPSVLYLGEPCRRLYESMPKLPWGALPKEVLKSWSPKALRMRAKDLLMLRGDRIQVREELANAESFTTILVNSRYSRESALRAYGRDARVCYLGIDATLFENQGLPREKFVIGLGSLTPSKNVEMAIRAVAAMRHRVPLVWVGNTASPDYRATLDQLANKLSVDFQVRQLIPDKELIRLLNTATAMVYTPRLEPFGLAPLEANACGTPVVGVAEGGVRETVRHEVNGLLAEHDPQEVGAALDRLFDDPKLARALGEQGAKLVRTEWTVKAGIERLEQSLLRALA